MTEAILNDTQINRLCRDIRHAVKIGDDSYVEKLYPGFKISDWRYNPERQLRTLFEKHSNEFKFSELILGDWKITKIRRSEDESSN